MSEYWMREDGDVDFADGDVGDMNHEGIVIDRVQRDIAGQCERRFDVKTRRGYRFSDDDHIDWDEFLTALGTAAGEEMAEKNPKWAALAEDDPHRFVPYALKQAGVNRSEFDCASGRGDARDYAMERWGWKTYRNGNIDTWKLGRGDLQAIVGGIESIADESGWSDRRLNRMDFAITVFSTRKHFNLTFAQLKRWLERPQAVPPTQQGPDYRTQQADKQLRSAEIDKLHPFYKGRGGAFGGGGVVNPLGDSRLHPFRNFLESASPGWLRGV